MKAEIPEQEARIKLLRVKTKVMTKGGIIQLGFHDGKSLLEGKHVEEEMARALKPGDTVLFDLKTGKILSHLPLELGKLALVTRGEKMGRVGVIREISQPHKLRPKEVALESDGEAIRTVIDYVFVVGEKAPMIALPKPGA